MASQDITPDRCLICYSEIRKDEDERQSYKRGRKGDGSSSGILKNIDIIFILSNLLEVPVQNLQTYLMSWGSPETWISVCLKCENAITDTKLIHCEMIGALKKFKKLKGKVIEAVKQSKCREDLSSGIGHIWKNPNRIITDQIRNFVSINIYGDFTNPFPFGDQKADELLLERNVLRPAELENTGVWKIKKEPDFDDNNIISFSDDDNQQLAPSEADITDCHYNDLEVDRKRDTVCENSSIKLHPTTSEKHTFQDNNGSTGTDNNFCSICEVRFPANKYEDHFVHLHTGQTLEDHLKQINGGDDVGTHNTNTFSSKDNNNHVSTVGSSKSCNKCPRKFSNEGDLWMHQDLHKTSPFHCFICRSVHRNKHNLRFHLWKHHPSTRTRKNCSGGAENGESLSRQPKRVKCNDCTLYILPDLMQEHADLHKTSPHSCCECGNVFVNNQKLMLHLGKYHRETYFLYKEKRSDISQILDPVTHVSERRCTRRWSKNIKSTNNDPTNEELSESNMDEHDDKMDADDFDWTPGTTNDSETISRSTPTHTVKSRREKTFLTCPLCEGFKYRKGKIESLMTHFPVCEVLKGRNNGGIVNDLTCPLCNENKVTFTQQLDYCEHVLVCKENYGKGQPIPLTHRIFECNLCSPKPYFGLEDFIKHFKDHIRTIYKCTKCPQRFTVTSQVTHHWTKDHGDALKSVQPLYRYTRQVCVPELFWWCKFCGEKFVHEDTRDSHISTSHEQELPIKSHTCSACCKAYFCEYELKLHEGTAHATNSLGVMICDICKQQFRTALQLKNHRMKRHRVELLVCDICGTECNSRSTLSTHMKKHETILRHVCQHCGKSFTVAQYLDRHIYKMHTAHDAAVNPQLCTICGKVFSSKSYLNAHIAALHQKQYKYKCTICKTGIYSSSHLKVHMASKHQIGEQKKYPCTVEGCQKKFLSSAKLKTHLTTHTGNPQYACKYCQKAFHTNQHRRRHEQIHTNAESKPFQCEICAKCFPVRNYLYIHMRSHKKKLTN